MNVMNPIPTVFYGTPDRAIEVLQGILPLFHEATLEISRLVRQTGRLTIDLQKAKARIDKPLENDAAKATRSWVESVMVVLEGHETWG